MNLEVLLNAWIRSMPIDVVRRAPSLAEDEVFCVAFRERIVGAGGVARRR